MKPLDYFSRHSVFRFEDFAEAHSKKNNRRSIQTSYAVLKQHVKAGNLLHIRRGMYAVVPRGISSKTYQVNPYHIAAISAPNAIISHHAALQFHGKAHSISRRYTYLTTSRAKSFEFQGMEFIPVPIPPALKVFPNLGGGIVEKPGNGQLIRVTTLERTMVDILHTPRYGGGWEEIWRSLEGVEYFDPEAVAEYAIKLNSAATIARVGFFLEQHREQLMLKERHLSKLAKHTPRTAIYLDRTKREPGKLFKRWNLIVPEYVFKRTWMEVT